MTPRLTNSSDEGEIRHILEDWAEAVRNRDAARLVAHFSPDVAVFDLNEPLRFAGIDTVRKRVETWLSSFEGAVGYEIRDLKITANAGIAFCHSLNRVIATRRDGTQIDMWWRATVCFRKLERGWTVMHEHSSVPFDMEKGTASFHLKP